MTESSPPPPLQSNNVDVAAAGPSPGAGVRRRIAIAGASGFVGSALVAALAPDHDVIALGRSAHGPSEDPAVTFRRCDLYDAEAAIGALEGATAAVYLVHSMLPSASLVQASFSDLDVICADNFARAAARANVSHIVYLGGLMPEHPDHLSEHLRSRQEVERVLASHGARVTTLRAGMVIGAGGSSFRILLRLAQRLPWMVIPRWGASKSQSIGLADVVRLLVFAVEHPELADHAYDVGSPSILSYAQMLERTVLLLGKTPHITTLPFNVPVVSLLWVSAITGSSLDLVMPLIESLKHEMVATRGLELQKAAGFDLSTFDTLVAAAIGEEAALESAPEHAPRSTAGPVSTSSAAEAPRRKTRRVVSLQRFVKPESMSARDVADAYFAWLPRGMRPFVRVTQLSVPGCAFWLAGFPHPLLELTLDGASSDETRAVFRVSGGWLSSPDARGRGTFEFRSVLGGDLVMALVSGFEPRLPWFIYKATQAIVHLWVMKAFGRRLFAMRADAAESARNA